MYLVQLFHDPITIPENCEIRYFDLQTSIFNKFRLSNEWLYVTKREPIYITCDGERESDTHTLEGVGIIALNDTCKAYATRDILIPSRNTQQQRSQYFIPNTRFVQRAEFHKVQNRNTSIQGDRLNYQNKLKDLDHYSSVLGENSNKIDIEKTIKELGQDHEIYNYMLAIIVTIEMMGILIIGGLIMHNGVNRIRRPRLQPARHYSHPETTIPMEELATNGGPVEEIPLTRGEPITRVTLYPPLL